MKTIYNIVSYNEAGNMIESFPTTPDLFRVAQKAYGSIVGDCLEITADIYEQLNRRFSVQLDLTKAHYYLERCGDYGVAARF